MSKKIIIFFIVIILMISGVYIISSGSFNNQISDNGENSSNLDDVNINNNTKIRITVDDKVTTATLIDSETTRDFVSLLPLTLDMDDLFDREKYVNLPRPISENSERTENY